MESLSLQRPAWRFGPAATPGSAEGVTRGWVCSGGRRAWGPPGAVEAVQSWTVPGAAGPAASAGPEENVEPGLAGTPGFHSLAQRERAGSPVWRKPLVATGVGRRRGGSGLRSQERGEQKLWPRKLCGASGAGRPSRRPGFVGGCQESGARERAGATGGRAPREPAGSRPGPQSPPGAGPPDSGVPWGRALTSLTPTEPASVMAGPPGLREARWANVPLGVSLSYPLPCVFCSRASATCCSPSPGRCGSCEGIFFHSQSFKLMLPG